ncbi:phospholipase A1 VesT1.02-like [Sitodiplosis mosellana]|uniref:phospholipase A1 VesT1.02-like n=1 Tax=Sitodiplosis mosellana TaxID=263140 RepID=UPI002444C91A|nr:phospholipase A1 VesT1.02-like [Sitodiplosis mosellana]
MTILTCSIFALTLVSTINLIDAQGPVATALFLGEPGLFNTTREDCVWKHVNDGDQCPDPDITMTLFPPKKLHANAKVDIAQRDWLRNSGWDREKENVILIHGYGGSVNALPMSVLRDAYVNHGDYNVFMVDWGVLCRPPCYVAAVNNLKPVANCLAQAFTFLRNSGMPVQQTLCVGHSLGAHVCGLMANYLDFRIERIIALDPARPLISPVIGNRLDSGDAKSVQVMHTNAGYYGEGGRVGHVDFCINGGRRQPYCSSTSNANLCSHIWSVCYLSQSIYDSSLMNAEPCTRRCPVGIRRHNRFLYRQNVGFDIPMGQHTPINAYGSYCLKDNGVPFCPSESNPVGDVRCCIGAQNQDGGLDEISYRDNSIETMVDLMKSRDRT